MGFKKGQSGNPSGRPKGAKNRTTENIRSKIDSFLESKMEEIEQDYEQMEPKDRLQFITKLLDFSIPKLRSQEVKGEKTIVNSSTGLEHLTFEELQDLLREELNI